MHILYSCAPACTSMDILLHVFKCKSFGHNGVSSSTHVIPESRITEYFILCITLYLHLVIRHLMMPFGRRPWARTLPTATLRLWQPCYCSNTNQQCHKCILKFMFPILPILCHTVSSYRLSMFPQCKWLAILVMLSILTPQISAVTCCCPDVVLILVQIASSISSLSLFLQAVQRGLETSLIRLDMLSMLQLLLSVQ